MNKIIISSALIASVLFSFSNNNISTTSIVTLVGAHIKCRDYPVNEKYPRKKCPVCKGTGKYISGDGIKEVDCGYCDPNK
jgi:hypothetical protein